MQESFSEITLAELPARHLQHGARPAGLLPGHPRRRSRRLPPHRARTPGRARGRRARAARVPPRRQVAQSRVGLRRLPARAHPAGDLTIEPIDVPRAAEEGLGRRRDADRAPAKSRGVTPLGVAKHGQPAMGQEGKAQYIATKIPLMEREVARRARALRRRGDDHRRVRIARQVREVRDQPAARRGPPHRLRPPDHAVAVPLCRARRSAAGGANVQPRRELRALRGPARRRRAHRSRRPSAGHVHRRRVDRPLRLRRRAASSTSRSSPSASSRCTKTENSRSSPVTSSSRTRFQEHQK